MELVCQICSIVSTFFVCTGAVFGWYKWCDSIRVRRADTLTRLFELCMEKDGVYLTLNSYVLDQRILYKGNLEFADRDGGEHKPATIKTRIDMMLTFYNQVCYMQEHEFLKEEFVVFENQIAMLKGFRPIRDYICDLKMQASFPYQCLANNMGI